MLDTVAIRLHFSFMFNRLFCLSHTNETKMWICSLLLMTTTMYQGVQSHKDHLGRFSLDAKDAHSFLHSRVKRSDPRCNTNEPYCEMNKESCMHQNEDSREQFCARGHSCSSEQTCYLLVPCPAHYELGCSDDPCLGIPCQNLGTCDRSAIGYRCQCLPEFDGNIDCLDLDCRPGPADIVFVIDASSSVESSFEQSKNFVFNITSRLPIGGDDFRFAVITYSLQSQVEFTFDDYNTTEDVLNAISSIQTHNNGPTYTERALKSAFQLLRNSGRNAYGYIILFSDGLSTDRKRTIQEADRIRNYGKFIYTVGVGDDIEQQELLDMASESRDFGGIKHVFSWSQTDDCYNMILNQTIHSKCQNCTVHSNSEVVLIFDTTMTQQDSELGKDAMVKFIEYLNKLNPSIATGLVSTGSDVTFNYQSVTNTNCCDKCSMLNCVQKIQSDTNKAPNYIESALKVSADNGFSNTTNIPEPNRKFLVLFSDGQWRDEQRIQDTIVQLHSRHISVLIVVIGKNNIDTTLSVARDANFVFYMDDISKYHQFESIASKLAHVMCPGNMFA